MTARRREPTQVPALMFRRADVGMAVEMMSLIERTASAGADEEMDAALAGGAAPPPRGMIGGLDFDDDDFDDDSDDSDEAFELERVAEEFDDVDGGAALASGGAAARGATAGGGGGGYADWASGASLGGAEYDGAAEDDDAFAFGRGGTSPSASGGAAPIGRNALLDDLLMPLPSAAAASDGAAGAGERLLLRPRI